MIAGQHVYFIASLPMLHFPGKPPFSYGDFLASCGGLIPEAERRILEGIPRLFAGVPAYPRQPTLEKWAAFESALRNELVRLRCQQKKIEARHFMRGDTQAEPDYAQAAASAVKFISPLEAEFHLDQVRWFYLEELSFAHYFDFDFLVVYALKLLILERWERFNQADKMKLLEAALAVS